MRLEQIKRDHLRRMSEPDDLRELRRQAERIRAARALDARGLMLEFEKDRLRREIRSLGEKPVP